MTVTILVIAALVIAAVTIVVFLHGVGKPIGSSLVEKADRMMASSFDFDFDEVDAAIAAELHKEASGE